MNKKDGDLALKTEGNIYHSNCSDINRSYLEQKKKKIADARIENLKSVV